MVEDMADDSDFLDYLYGPFRPSQPGPEPAHVLTLALLEDLAAQSAPARFDRCWQSDHRRVIKPLHTVGSLSRADIVINM